jgi:hypothetical protein
MRKLLMFAGMLGVCFCSLLVHPIQALGRPETWVTLQTGDIGNTPRGSR